MSNNRTTVTVLPVAFLLFVVPPSVPAQENVSSLRQAPAATDAFSIIVLPDTQNYADIRIGFAATYWKKGDLSTNFLRQTAWIKENAKKLKIAMALHVGDVTQGDDDAEWQIADQAYRAIDGTVPYCIAIGNHDMGYQPASGRLFSRPKFAVSRETTFNRYFGPSRFADRAWYGGHFGDGGENSYCLFEASGLNLIVVSLEFKPRDAVIEWANRILTEHKDRRATVLTHAYLDPQNRLSTNLPYGVGGNPGADVWKKCISLHANIFMVVSSHEYGERRLMSAGNAGNRVYQLSANYEDQNGGEGYLRIMTFVPSQNQIGVKTYSPVLGTFKTGPESQFTLEYPMQ